MRKTLLCIFIVVCLLLPQFTLTGAEDTVNKKKIYGMHTPKQIADVKKLIANGDKEALTAFTQFIERANYCMDEPLRAVENFIVKGYYTYPKEHIEGNKSITYNAYAAYATALAWRLTGETKYAEKAKEILNGWASINKSISTEEDCSLVAAYGGVGLINAAELLEDFPGWTSEQQLKFKTWVMNIYFPNVNSIVSKTNNWADWGILAVITTYCYLDDAEGVSNMVSKMKSLIDYKIMNTGELPDETKREGNGMWYTYFSLTPKTAAAQVAYNSINSNVYNYVGAGGGSIKKALDFFLYYLKNPNEWRWYEPSKLYKPKFANGANLEKPTNWPTNLYAAMGSVFLEQSYNDLVKDVAPALGGWTERLAHHIAWCFPSLMKPEYNYQELEIPLAESAEYDFENGLLGENWKVFADLGFGTKDDVYAKCVSDPKGPSNKCLQIVDRAYGEYYPKSGIKKGFLSLEHSFKPLNGKIEVSFDIMVADMSTWSGIQFADDRGVIPCSIMIADNGCDIILKCAADKLGGEEKEIVLVKDVDNNKWYHIKAVMDTADGTVAAWVNNENGYKGFFTDSAWRALNKISFITAPCESHTVNYYDNIYVGRAR